MHAVCPEVGDGEGSLSGQSLLDGGGPLFDVGVRMVARHGAGRERQAGGGCEGWRDGIGELHVGAVGLYAAGEQGRRLGVDNGTVFVTELDFTVVTTVA